MLKRRGRAAGCHPKNVARSAKCAGACLQGLRLAGLRRLQLQIAKPAYLGRRAQPPTHKEKNDGLARTTTSAAARALAPTSHSSSGGWRKKRSALGLAAGSSWGEGGQENDGRRLWHGTRFIAPVRVLMPSRGRNWHLSSREGCQRVTEPNLSPLLYKT
jgi:hypothetical protein